MRESWPHAPPHHFTTHGTYLITAATLYRKRLFDSSAKLDLLRDTTFELAKSYALLLQAWAFFTNHYHIVMNFENTATTHRDFMRHLHRELRYGSIALMPLPAGGSCTNSGTRA